MKTEVGVAQRRRGAEELRALTAQVIDIGLSIHKTLGPGLLESVYEEVLAFELAQAGLAVERQVARPIDWKGRLLGEPYRMDLVVEDCLVIELKSVEKTAPVHKKQLITYLKLSGLPVGLLLNFGTELFRDGIERLVNGVQE